MANISEFPPAAGFFGLPPFPPTPHPQPCPGDDEFEEWKKQIGGGGNKTKNRATGYDAAGGPGLGIQQPVVQGQGRVSPMADFGPRVPPREYVVFYVIGLVGSEDGYFVDLSTDSPYSTHNHPDETTYPNGYLTLELSLSEWNTLMVGQVIPTTLTL